METEHMAFLVNKNGERGTLCITRTNTMQLESFESHCKRMLPVWRKNFPNAVDFVIDSRHPNDSQSPPPAFN